jgi:hypothetical protein
LGVQERCREESCEEKKRSWINVSDGAVRPASS